MIPQPTPKDMKRCADEDIEGVAMTSDDPQRWFVWLQNTACCWIQRAHAAESALIAERAKREASERAISALQDKDCPVDVLGAINYLVDHAAAGWVNVANLSKVIEEDTQQLEEMAKGRTDLQAKLAASEAGAAAMRLILQHENERDGCVYASHFGRREQDDEREGCDCGQCERWRKRKATLTTDAGRDLLKRLEAAECVCSLLGKHGDCPSWEQLREALAAWRATKGA